MRLVLEIDSADPLEGRLGREGDELRRFRGWIGLAAAVEDELAAEDASADRDVRPSA